MSANTTQTMIAFDDLRWEFGYDQNCNVKAFPYIYNKSKDKIKVLTTGQILNDPIEIYKINNVRHISIHYDISYKNNGQDGLFIIDHCFNDVAEVFSTDDIYQGLTLLQIKQINSKFEIMMEDIAKEFLDKKKNQYNQEKI